MKRWKAFFKQSETLSVPSLLFQYMSKIALDFLPAQSV